MSTPSERENQSSWPSSSANTHSGAINPGAINPGHTNSGSTNSGWEQIYNQVPLCEVPRHFAGIKASPFMTEYLSSVLRLCPRGGRTLETGSGSGYGAVWLSLRGIRAEGIDLSPRLVERSRQINALLEGQARFETGDLFHLYSPDSPLRFDVIHHQGVLEHFDVPHIRAALAQQVAIADHVVFSVPSVYYPFEPEFGDERLLGLEEWQRILAPFEVVELRLTGDPQHGRQEHVLAILRGQPVTDELRALMQVSAQPYPDGISAIVHTRNEASRIVECLQSLHGWTDEILVCDMESEDDTVELARPLCTHILHHPRIPNFDRARNASAMRARFRWVFYLDADERVPPRLGPALRHIIAAQASGAMEPFSGLLIPFRHHFAGHWMRCLYPGYTAPRLLRNGKFSFNPRLHAGTQVEGAILRFPAEDPDLALVHYSYDSLSHYLTKLNSYTDGEALNLYRDGAPFSWQNAIRQFVGDFQSYYEGANAAQDGVHGFLYSFLSGFYRFEQHAKLYEHRYRAGQLHPFEQQVPASLEEMLEFALQVVREKPLPALQPLRIESFAPESASNVSVDSGLPTPETEAASALELPIEATSTEATSTPEVSLASSSTRQNVVSQTSSTRTPLVKPPLVWTGPLLDPSGYGEGSRNFLFGLDEIGVPLAAQVLPWSHDVVDMSEADRERLARLEQVLVAPGFTQILHTLASQFGRDPQAETVIGRTMFETDRLPESWVQACQKLDYLWVPTEFHRRTFQDAGLPASKLAVIPESLDPGAYALAQKVETLRAAMAELPSSERQLLESLRQEQESGKFVFLSVFDWTLHKGWDVLLRGFVRAFEGRDDVRLLLRVWSTQNYGAAGIHRQAAELLARELGHDLNTDSRIRFIEQRLTRSGLCALNAQCDAFVLPSRGEGWGRPYMEAMACGKPTIGTAWSGNTAFMTRENSYLIDCEVRDVPPHGWQELPTYKGHRWAQPNEAHFIETLRRVREERNEGRAIGARAREEMLTRFDRRVVAQHIAKELERIGDEQGSVTAIGLPQDGVAASKPTASKPTIAPLTSDILMLPNSPAVVSSPVLAPESRASIAMRWEGAFFNWHSLGQVNREFTLALSELRADELDYEGATGDTPTLLQTRRPVAPAVELSLAPTEPPQFSPQVDPRFGALAGKCFAPLSKAAQVHVRHCFPPRFERPAEGRFVLMQPWEYGYLPSAWIAPIQGQVDQVWCYSEYVRRVYLASGIPDEKLRVVPLGIDPHLFRPDGASYVFTDEPGAKALWDKGERKSRETFVFLFAGGSIHRKGIDILLEAYRRAFTRLDDVCLVIKDTGVSTVYRDANAREQILSLTQDASHPPVVYLDADLPGVQLANLYRSANCLVQPYRGEGFCLPVLEAMACGTPSLVPRGGPTDDFVDETVGWRIEAEHKPFNVSAQGRGRVGHYDCVGPTWMFEVSPDVLARRMRTLVQERDEVQRRGEAAAERARGQWTWRHSARSALGALQELIEQEEREDTLHRFWNLPLQLRQATEKPLEQEKASGTNTSTSTPESLEVAGMTPRKAPSLPTISLCMIVRDEERVLDECLTSAKPWFDEIILVDTGSTDRTVEIADSHGAKVFHFPWCDDFSAARNISLEHASGEWVFWMDADDTLPAKCGEQLKQLAWLAEEKTFGFIAQVHIPAGPGQVGFTIVDHVKLFRNRKDLRFEGRIHEQILEPIHCAGGVVERSSAYVVHSGYDYSPQGQEKKRVRDLTLLEKDLADRPNHPFVLFNIGMTAYHLKEYEKAIPTLEKCLAVSKPHESTVRKVYAMLAGCHAEQGQLEQAKVRLEQGLELFPLDPELLFRAGIIYRDLGDLPRAVPAYCTLLSSRESGHVDSLDVTMTGFKAHHNLALIYRDLEQLALAEEQFRLALSNYREFVPSWLGLAEICLRQGRFEEVDPICEQLDALAPEEARRLRGHLPPSSATRPIAPPPRGAPQEVGV